MLIQDGLLVEVGTTRRVENLAIARNAIEVSAAGRVVMPGFVDSHTHMLFPVSRSSALDVEEGVRALHTTTGLRLKMQAHGYLQAMARHGTTTVEVKTGCGPSEDAELKILRVLAEIKLELLELAPSLLFRLPPAAAVESQLAWDWICNSFLPKVRRRKFASFADYEWGEETALNLANAIKYFDLAQRFGFGRKMHVTRAGAGPAVKMAVALALTSIDHLEYATAEEIASLGSSGTVATLLPWTSLYGDLPYAPARALIDAGAAVALATNFNPHSSKALSMQATVGLACLRLSMTVEEAISAATINGAHALGMSANIGSLEPGKSADLLLLNVSDYRDLGSQFGTNLVHMTMKHGEFIYEEGEVGPRPAEDLRPAW